MKAKSGKLSELVAKVELNTRLIDSLVFAPDRSQKEFQLGDRTPKHEPTPEEIAKATAEIRSTWSEHTERMRRCCVGEFIDGTLWQVPTVEHKEY